MRKSSPFVQYLLDDDARDRDGGSAARYHDGFFARVGVGLSYADWKENSSRWAVPAEVLVGGGGSYTFGLVLGFHEGLGTGQASDTNPGTNLSGFGFGGFLQYHPLRDGGLAIQSRVLLMNNTFAAGGGVGERNRPGFAAGIGAGYEWWIAKQLAAGATTMVTFFSDRSGMVPIPSAGVTVTYH